MTDDVSAAHDCHRWPPEFYAYVDGNWAWDRFLGVWWVWP